MPQPRSQPPKRSATTRELLSASPPHDKEAEQAVLGAILRENLRLAELAEILKEEDFYFASHQKIWRCMLDLWEAWGSDLAIDPYTLGQQLASHGWLLEVGGAKAIIDLVDQTITSANGKFYARKVKEASLLRSVAAAATQVLRSAHERDAPPDEILAEAEKVFAQAQAGTFAAEPRTIGQILHDVAKDLDHRKQKKTQNGVPTGLHELDSLVGKMRGGEMTVLGARPGVGKTALAMGVAEYAASAGHHVHVLSIEMPEAQLVERTWASTAGVPAHIVRKGLHSAEEARKLVDVFNRLASLPIRIDELHGATMGKVKSSCRRAAMKGECDLIVVDYLQLVRSGEKERSKHEEVSKVSGAMKDLAKSLNVPVLVLCQLNREMEKTHRRPQLSDLRDSGAIEQDADIVLLLHREKVQSPAKAEVIVAKNRFGSEGVIELFFRPELVRFENRQF